MMVAGGIEDQEMEFDLLELVLKEAVLWSWA